MTRLVLALLLLGTMTACGSDPAASTSPDAGASVTTTSSVTGSSATTATPSSPASSPSGTATATHAATTAPGRPSGAVVNLPGSGTTLASVGQINDVTWLSPEAKVFMTSELKRVQVGGSCARITISGYRVADLLNGGVSGCGGGYAVLWGKTAAGWKVLIAGQDTPACKAIRTAGWTATIPKNFYGGRCYEGTSVVEYKP